MGLVVSKRPSAYLDANVASGLALDSTARLWVSELRRNGYQVLLSIAVVREIARARKKRRDRVIRAVLEYCDAVSLMQAGQILRREFQGLVEGKAPPPVPLLPIERLRVLLNEGSLIRTLGDVWARDDLDPAKILDDLRRGLRGRSWTSFEDFLKLTIGPLAKLIIKASDGDIPDLRGNDPPDENWARVQLEGTLINITLLAANAFRAGTRTLRKGKGSLSDLKPLIEAAGGEVFLTRDVELFETFELARTAVSDFQPEVRLVPHATQPLTRVE